MRAFKLIYLSLVSIAFLLVSCATEETVKVGVSIGPQHERWVKDGEFLRESLEKQGAEVYILNAEGVDTMQRNHVNQLLEREIDVLIMAPLDSREAGKCVEKAKSKGVKVIAYDRIIKDCDLDFYTSFDNVKVGELQADYLTKIKPQGNYIIMGGAPTDNNSALLRLGQMTILQPLITKGDISIVFDQYISRWDENVAFEELNSYLYKNKDITAVIASSDAIAKGAFKALLKHKLDGKVLLSGQDAQLDACKRIVKGNQTMTVYKMIESLAYSTANVAMALAKDEELPNSYLTVNNGQKMVPALLLQNMIQVTSENMRMTVIADGYLDEKAVFSAK